MVAPPVLWAFHLCVSVDGATLQPNVATGAVITAIEPCTAPSEKEPQRAVYVVVGLVYFGVSVAHSRGHFRLWQQRTGTALRWCPLLM